MAHVLAPCGWLVRSALEGARLGATPRLTACRVATQTPSSFGERASLNSRAAELGVADTLSVSSHTLDVAVVEDAHRAEVQPLWPSTLHFQTHATTAFREDTSTLPFLLYLPDLDGLSIMASRQFPNLASACDLRSLNLAPDNRTPWPGLVQAVTAYLRRELVDCPAERSVILAGESFGALLALAAARECVDLVDRVLLINPATSFPGSSLEQAAPLLQLLPEAAYATLPWALAPVLLNPFALTAPRDRAERTGTDAAAVGNPLQMLESARLATDVLQQFTRSLPLATLRWRMGLMRKAAQGVNAQLKEVPQRTMVLAAADDRLLPSADEAKRLAKALPRAFARVLPGASHAVLGERGTDLLALIREEGFLVGRRLFTSPLAVGKRCANGFGTAEPLELPLPQEVDRVAGEWTRLTRSLTSPVYFSTAADGAVLPGLGGIPEDRPLLVIGNHSLFATDMNLMIEDVLRERGILLRGLAHPAVMRGAAPRAGAEKDAEEQASFLQPEVMRSLYATFGAVPATPRNIFHLFKNREAVLLYPGGVREAFKRRGEANQLFWPTRAEFVRMAARAGAVILPLASLGADESLGLLLDSDELRANPLLNRGGRVEADATRFPRVRVGLDDESTDQSFVPPVAFPLPPERYYFLFRQPIVTSPADADDRVKCDAIYRHCKAEVEAGLAYLQAQRVRDPYQHPVPRLLYERSQGGTRQAPTFAP